MKLVKIWQTLALEKGRIYNPTDVQPLYITEDMRKNLGKINNKDISLTDANLAETLKPFIDISQISDDQAFEVVKNWPILPVQQYINRNFLCSQLQALLVVT